MYKVFVDNVSKIYQLDDENDLLKVFGEYNFIEAAGGIVRRDHQYIFIKRNGLWDIPKGKLEKNESIEECAVREIEEECGLIKPIIERHLINTWHTYTTAKGKKFLKKTYWYLLNEGNKKVNLVPQLEEGITEVKFFSVNDFNEIKENTYASIKEVLKQL
jgi:8-oxo-dGTP pyrophosphatase MutT (NUDIX family)